MVGRQEPDGRPASLSSWDDFGSHGHSHAHVAKSPAHAQPRRARSSSTATLDVALHSSQLHTASHGLSLLINMAKVVLCRPLVIPAVTVDLVSPPLWLVDGVAARGGQEARSAQLSLHACTLYSHPILSLKHKRRVILIDPVKRPIPTMRPLPRNGVLRRPIQPRRRINLPSLLIRRHAHLDARVRAIDLD